MVVASVAAPSTQIVIGVFATTPLSFIPVIDQTPLLLVVVENVAGVEVPTITLMVLPEPNGVVLSLLYSVPDTEKVAASATALPKNHTPKITASTMSRGNNLSDMWLLEGLLYIVLSAGSLYCRASCDLGVGVDCNLYTPTPSRSSATSLVIDLDLESVETKGVRRGLGGYPKAAVSGLELTG